jgi:hypothetical protein
MQIPPHQILLWMAMIAFVAGLITLMGGILILVFRVSGRDVRALTRQTAQLAQKNITEDISQILGNASTLMDSMNQLIRTSAGIGVFLSCLGLVIMVASCALIVMLQRIPA